MRQLPAVAALLDPAEGEPRVGFDEGVYEAAAGVELFRRDALAPRLVAGEDRRAETENRVVRDLYRLRLVLDDDYPGDRAEPQPVHTAYVSAADVEVDTPRRWGAAALAVAEQAAEVVSDLATPEVIAVARQRWQHSPIEDLRIDLEDGYGWRGDLTEDADARRAGTVLAAWANRDSQAPDAAGSPRPPRIAGVRAKGLGAAERERGLDPERSIFEACMLRFRPIMMTTMCALLAGMPLMLGTGTGSELRRPLGFAMVGGLALSQLLTLFTTPVIYLYLDRASRWYASRASRRQEAVSTATPAGSR